AIVYDEDIAGTTRTLTTWDTDRSEHVSVYESGQIASQENYDSDGTKISAFTYDASGSRTSASYFNGDTGALEKAITYATDGGRSEHQYGITGTSYTEQVLNYDSSGKLVFQERYAADGAKVSTMVGESDGSTHTSYYDSLGRVSTESIVYADGSHDSISHSYEASATEPSSTSQWHYAAGTNALLWSDVMSQDGSHVQASYGTSVTLSSHENVTDTFYGSSSGSDTFVVTGSNGHDVVSGFQAGSGTIHDVLVIDDVESFDQLLTHATVQGNDVLIQLNDQDSILLQNVTLSTLTADNFQFLV
ncbi:hypothetical protein V5F81_18840, partial [Xanthobacter autotrophicus]